MRDLFPGYFTPTEEEFQALWREATFAFDANVLLGLYRLTSETRQVFFDVLQRLGDRIFLPNRAAHEYLRNRLSAISARSGSHEAVKVDAAKFVQGLEVRLKEHSLPEGQEIVEAAKKAEKKIADIVDAAIKREPDLLHSDDLQSRLTALFDGKTGPHYDSATFDGLCQEAKARYARKIPPGFKDENKGEPDRYGDALIWFQLLDFAKSTKKPVVFITRDTKEDWWLQHNGETIGPRPELVQEMKQVAAVRFYMYTTPRFLEFAQQFFDLKPEPTKKATSEIEKIEKQEKEAAEQIAYVTWGGLPSAPFQYGPLDKVVFDDNVVASAWQPGTFTTAFTGMKILSPEEMEAEKKRSEAETRRFLLFPINGQVIDSSYGKWKCEIAGTEEPPGSDLVCYRLKFQPQNPIRSPRHLSLWLSMAGLHSDADRRYKSAIYRIIAEWLNSGKSAGEIKYVI